MATMKVRDGQALFAARSPNARLAVTEPAGHGASLTVGGLAIDQRRRMRARMTSHLASVITKAASRQTYYTIRLLVDRPLVDDAFRAYAYFRWVDDVLDAVASTGWAAGDAERMVRMRFLERQNVKHWCRRGSESSAT